MGGTKGKIQNPCTDLSIVFLNFSLWSPLWNNENKSCLNELKFWEASENHKSSICWKFQLSISCRTQKSAKIPLPVAKMIWSFWFWIHLDLKPILNDQVGYGPGPDNKLKMSRQTDFHYNSKIWEIFSQFSLFLKLEIWM